MIDKLRERINNLTIQRQQAEAVLNKAFLDMQAIDGAIQEVGYWIAQIEKDANDGPQGDDKDA